MKRPTVKKLCVADRYASPGERIVEFTFPNGLGGLIALRQFDDGRAVVDVYRCDEGIEVRPEPERGRGYLYKGEGVEPHGGGRFSEGESPGRYQGYNVDEPCVLKWRCLYCKRALGDGEKCTGPDWLLREVRHMTRSNLWEVRCCESIARGLMREARRHLRSGAGQQAESTTRHARVWWREANRLRRIAGEA